MHPGVFFDINYHYPLDKSLELTQVDKNFRLLKTLADSWESFLAHSDQVAPEIADKFKAASK